jgi:hypothetical protein
MLYLEHERSIVGSLAFGAETAPKGGAEVPTVGF